MDIQQKLAELKAKNADLNNKIAILEEIIGENPSVLEKKIEVRQAVSEEAKALNDSIEKMGKVIKRDVKTVGGRQVVTEEEQIGEGKYLGD
jgi:hypothetical protein